MQHLFNQFGYEVFKVGDQRMKRKEIRAEFKRLEKEGIVRVVRSVGNTPVYIQLCFEPQAREMDRMLRQQPKRDWTITQTAGQRFIDAQAWAISEVRRELKRRFRSDSTKEESYDS